MNAHDCQIPLVSIVTVCLNAAATIEDALCSVALQTVGFSIQHIVVDGGSSDSTRGIIDKCAALFPHITRIYERDEGIFDAMNKGLRIARGEYVLFLNADDFFSTPNSLAAAMTGLSKKSDENPDLIAGDVVMGKVGRWGVWRHRKAPRLLNNFKGCGWFPIHQGLFTKRRLLEVADGFDPRLKLASDVVFFYDLERKFNPSIRITRTRVTFMQDGGAANANFRAIGLGTIEIYRHLRATHGLAKSLQMVLCKSMQSLSEVRIGMCPIHRWFITE